MLANPKKSSHTYNCSYSQSISLDAPVTRLDSDGFGSVRRVRLVVFEAF